MRLWFAFKDHFAGRLRASAHSAAGPSASRFVPVTVRKFAMGRRITDEVNVFPACPLRLVDRQYPFSQDTSCSQLSRRFRKKS